MSLCRESFPPLLIIILASIIISSGKVLQGLETSRGSRTLNVDRFADNEEVPCKSGFLDGVCTYALRCLNSRMHAESSCRKRFSTGVCCTNRTTLSLVQENNELDTKTEKAECGTLRQYQNLNSKIVNGSAGTYGQFPWTVSLRLLTNPKNRESATHYCGGTLLNSEWVVTSGHCIYFDNYEYIVLRIGEFNESSSEEPHPFVERSVMKKIIHPDFRIKDFYSDIGLLKINEPVSFHPNIQPICLPGNEDSLAKRPGIVSGWGRRKENGSVSDVIRMVSLPILTNRECEKMFLMGKVIEEIHDVFLCAGYASGRHDACTGDSGGPLQVKGKDGRIFLGGIVSWGYGCARPFKPGVYTRVSEFVPWILDQISANSETTKRT